MLRRPFLQTLAQLPRETRDTLFLLLVIAWVVLPQASHLPLWSMAMTAAVLLWRGKLAYRSEPLPGRFWLLGLLVLAMLGIFQTYRTLLGREAGITMVVTLLALKTLELRARRDAFVVFFLGFFALLTHFLYSQSLSTALSMLIGLWALLTALVNAHLPVSKQPLREAARTATRMVLLGTPIVAALFLFFPRVGPLWGASGESFAGKTGLSNTMRVGSMASLALDESVALRVKFEVAPPPPSRLYFRGPVMSYFDGQEWRPNSLIAPRIGPARAGLEVAGDAIRYQVTLEPLHRPWVIVLDAAAQAPDLPGYDIGLTADLQWVSNVPIAELIRYTAQSHTEFRYGPKLASAAPIAATELPRGFNPRTLALADQLRADPALRGADATAMSDAIFRRLRNGGYSYTLEPGVYGAHAADEFWFDRKEGFCEHIAAAYVILMRALNIPARIVTGYQGGELNGVDGYWTVRQSDAHAWAEYWQAGRGWVRADPTGAIAPARIGNLVRLQQRQSTVAAALANFSPSMVANLRSLWEATNNGWNQWVLAYSKTRQFNLLKDMGFAMPDWQALGYVLCGLLLASLSIAGLWTHWERHQKEPWLRLLEEARQKVAATGLELPPQAPPRLLANRLLAQFGDEARAAANWLLQLEIQRYGKAPDTSEASSARSSAPSATLTPSAANRRQALQQLKRDFSLLAWPTVPQSP